MVLLVSVLFLFGLAVGSFLNVVIDRLPRGRGIVKGRSYCDRCQHPLRWHDLIPLLSFVALRGRCRYCGERISLQNPLVELATGFIFASSSFLSSNFYLLNPSSILYLLSSVFLVPIFVIDLKRGIIPDKLIFPGIIFTLIIRIIEVGYRVLFLYQNLRSDTAGLGPYLLQTNFFKHHVWLEVSPLLWTLVGSVVLYFAFCILHFAFRGRALGGGDVKLVFLVGLVTGFPSMIVAVFSAFLTGALASIILIVLKRKRFGETVPFGPFLVVGTFIALFWGERVLNWYLGLL